MIQGPSGTGKTQVIAEICLQLIQHNPKIKILVCSETHVAVNNIITRIAMHHDRVRIVRIRDKENDKDVADFYPQSILKFYFSWTETAIENKDALKIIKEELDCPDDSKLEKAIALSANIIGMTCNRTASYNFWDSSEMFDVAIVDEACKATLPEILAPLIISKKTILVGDPKQLPPVFCTDEQSVIEKIEECDLLNYMYIDNLFLDNKGISFLETQYRMSNSIGNLISNIFYEGKLINGRNENIEDGLVWIDYSPSKRWPVMEDNNVKNIIYNEDECNIIKTLLLELQNDMQGKTIGVIAPYLAQVKLLRRECPTNGNIKIDTVDGFQGKECDTM